jgi:uncharacterized protein (TIGR03437 family)
VKQIFVVSPSLLMVNVSVNPGAPPTATTVTVTTGLQAATLSLGMQILAANPSQISLRAPVLNAATGLSGVPVGGTAVISMTNVPLSLTGWMLTIGGQTTGWSLVNGQINAIVPGGLTPGPAIVQLTSPTGATVPSIVMKIDAPLPVISSVLNAAGVPISSSQPAHPGDFLTLNTTGLSDGVTQITTSNIFVTADGVSVPVIQVNYPAIQVQLPLSVPTGTVPLAIGIGTRISAPVFLNIHN